MQAYLLSAAGVIFLSVIVSLLLPEGKLRKTAEFAMKLICILVLVQPVTSIFKIPRQDETELADYNFVAEEYSEHQSRRLEILISEEFSCESECRAEVVYSNGEFRVAGVEAAIEGSPDIIGEIESYLSGLGYINITVYAKSA